MRGRLFGRRAELEMLYEAWQAARRGSGRTVLVEGEAGVGKTRLLEEALRDMSDAPMITRAACFEHLQAAPFTPWLDALQGVLGLPRGASTSERTELARAYLEVRAPDFAEVGSLLNQLLALSLPQGEVVGSLDADARRQRLFELIAHILAEAAGEQAHVVVVEDLHWIDESSLALVDHLARHLGDTHVLLLLTSRPVDVPLDLGEGTGRMVLAELSEAESLGMVCEALGVEDLPAEVKETIFAKTRGNPLFLEEVVHSLQTPGVLDGILDASSVFRAEALAKLEIPDRVQGLLMSRIDRLPPDTREVLKAGSVVGRSFGERVLSGIDDGLLRSVTLGRAFAELIAAELVVRGEEDGAAFVTFRHALVQDVAYDSLPFSRRRELHGGIARYLEATQTSPDHGLLVHHYRRAGDAANTRVHAVRASESSVAVYASQEAVDYLTLALETAEARTSRDACLRSRFEELMGDSLETLSRHDDAVVCFARARRRWASPAVRRASEDALRKLAPLDDADARDSLLCWKIAVSVERGRSAYNRALRWIERGFATLPPERPGLAARMLVARCGFLSRLGRFREALTFGDEGLELARQDGDAGLQAYALSLLGLAFSGLGLLERASDCDAEAVTLYEQAGDLRGLAMSQANLASGYMFMGDLRGALEHDELALALYARIGNLNGVASQQHNVGGVLLQLGEIDAAVEHLEEALRLREHQGVNPMVTGYALVLLSQARVWSGDVEAAERELAEGVGILESIGAQGMLLDAGVVDVELRLAQGDLERAESSCRRVLSQAQSMGAELNEAQALCMLGKVQLAQGGPEAALPGLEASVALAEKIGSEYERARALAALAEARGSCADSTDACEDDLAEAIRLFERMGARYDLERAVGLRARLGSTVR